MLGIALVDKPAGMTSHDVVNCLRRRFHTRRIGHSGTLDPAATGLLILAIGPATRFLQYLPMEPKEYVGTICFGIETTTQDAEGEVVRRATVPDGLDAKIASVLPTFVGEIQQVPPMYSAIKRQGKPLYAYARAGTEVERDARTVYVHEIEMIEIDNDMLTFRVSCSGGTYVRTIAHDLGNALGCCAHLAELRRTRVGRFEVTEAKLPDQLEERDLLTLAEALMPMPVCTLPAETVAQARDGQTVHLGHAYDSRHVALADEFGNVFSVAATTGSMAKPLCVIPKESMRAEV